GAGNGDTKPQPRYRLRGRQVTRELGLEHQGRGAAVGEEVAELGLALPGPQGNRDRAEAEACQQEDQEFWAIAEQEGHAVARLDAAPSEVTRRIGREVHQSPIGQAPAVTDHGLAPNV